MVNAIPRPPCRPEVVFVSIFLSYFNRPDGLFNEKKKNREVITPLQREIMSWMSNLDEDAHTYTCSQRTHPFMVKATRECLGSRRRDAGNGDRRKATLVTRGLGAALGQQVAAVRWRPRAAPVLLCARRKTKTTTGSTATSVPLHTPLSLSRPSRNPPPPPTLARFARQPWSLSFGRAPAGHFVVGILLFFTPPEPPASTAAARYRAKKKAEKWVT